MDMCYSVFGEGQLKGHRMSLAGLGFPYLILSTLGNLLLIGSIVRKCVRSKVIRLSGKRFTKHIISGAQIVRDLPVHSMVLVLLYGSRPSGDTPDLVSTAYSYLAQRSAR